MTVVRQNPTVQAEAATFACRAHAGQLRTGTRFPYFVHPLGVGMTLRERYPSDPELEAAGYLHDVVEDTDVSLDEVRRRFGERVAWLVESVTKDGRSINYLALRMQDPDVARLKVADVLDNVRDTVRGLEKGHDVWARFSAGRDKALYWATIWRVASGSIRDEPLRADLGEILRSPVLGLEP